MKTSIKLLLLILATYLSCNAQVKIDNNVLMPISKYRSIRHKLFLCDTLIQRKDSLLELKNKEIQIELEKSAILQQALVECDSSNTFYVKKIKELTTPVEKRDRFIFKEFIYGTITGAILVLFTTAIL